MAERGRRQEILQAASLLFREKGYHGTTIRDIADKSGLLSGSLYAHIRTKEDLLFEITDEVADHFIRSLTLVVQSDSTPEQKFKRALSAHIAVVAEHLDAATVFSHEWKALSSERRQVIQEKRDAYEQLWSNILKEGVDAGVFTPSTDAFTRMVTLSVANWLYQWYDPSGTLSSDAVANRLSDVLLQGLKIRFD
jgi:TetR/AcrR family transcriptional regulator, cholesterol catabolism regulator